MSERGTPATRSQDGTPESDVFDLEQKAINERLMIEGENYFVAFPTQMICIAKDLSTNTAIGLTARKKAAEKLEIMAKLMKAQVWRSREEDLRKELVAGVMERVDARLNETVEKLTGKMEGVLAKAEQWSIPGLAQAVLEEGEVRNQPRTYANAMGAKEIAGQLQRP